METQIKAVTLETLARGAVGELFNEVHRRVLENILDLNTEAETKREITIKVSYYPSDDRESASIEIACTSKTAPVRNASSIVYIGRHRNEVVAIENDPKQQQLFEDAPKLVAFGGQKEEGGAQ